MKIQIMLAMGIVFLGTMTTPAFAQVTSIGSLADELENSKSINDDRILLIVYTELRWIGEIQDGNYITHPIKGVGNDKFEIPCGQTDIVSVSINPEVSDKPMQIYLIKDGKILKEKIISEPGESIEINADCKGEPQFQENTQDSMNWNYVAILLAVIGIAVGGGVAFIKKRSGN